MKHKAKPSPAAGEFLFEIDSEPLNECVRALGGVPLWVRAARSLDVPGRVQRHLQLKRRQRGFDEASYVESFLVLNAVGGDCLEDFDPLREDAGLAEMLGHAVPSAEAARKFLYPFHDEGKIEQAQRELAPGRVSYIPEESSPLQGLAQVNEEVVQELGRGGAEHEDCHRRSGRDRDRKLEAGSQVHLRRLYWIPAGAGAVGGVERGGGRRVPRRQCAGEPGAVADRERAFQALPETVREFYFRGDSACHEQSLLEWLREERRRQGPQGCMGFAVSARA
jgi:hypothetical protein